MRRIIELDYGRANPGWKVIAHCESEGQSRINRFDDVVYKHFICEVALLRAGSGQWARVRVHVTALGRYKYQVLRSFK